MGWKCSFCCKPLYETTIILNLKKEDFKTLLNKKYLRFSSSHSQKTKFVCVFFFRAERHDALYVVGALEEAMELRGMRYHPIDIETSVIRAHKSIMEW